MTRAAAPDVAQRYVKPWGTGLLHWLDRDNDNASRRLLVYLILSGKPVPLNIAELAETLNLSANALAKAMFSLNRDECISVLEQASSALAEKSWLAAGLAGLEQDMASILKPRQGMLLASEDGLLLASVGVSAYEAEVLAVQVRPDSSERQGAWQARWLKAGSHRFVLMWSHELDVRHVGLLKMGARLLLAAGETKGGLACECQ